jgi:hypothetical protein
LRRGPMGRLDSQIGIDSANSCQISAPMKASDRETRMLDLSRDGRQ